MILSYFLLYLVTLISILVMFYGYSKNHTNIYYFIIPVFIVFYILPSIIDFLTGTKFLGERYAPAMYNALVDEQTTIFYNLYISIVLIFFTFLMSRQKNTNINLISNSSKNIVIFYDKFKYLFWLAISLPTILVLYTGPSSYYAEYGTRLNINMPDLHLVTSKVVLVATFLEAIMITRHIIRFRNSNSFSYIVAIAVTLLFVVINGYIHGKRSIFITTLIVVFSLLYITNAVSRKKLSYISIVSLLLFIIFIYSYGKNISDSLIETLQSLRVSFSRDYGIKFVIYNDLLHNNPILPYKGASYLFLLTFFIPRALYIDKPYPYAVYFTNSAFGNFGGDYLYGWGLTTSFLSESISNLGWFGLIFFPLFYYMVIRKLNKINSLPFHAITYLVMILLLVIHPVAFMPLIIIWTILLLKANKRIVFSKPL